MKKRENKRGLLPYRRNAGKERKKGNNIVTVPFRSKGERGEGKGKKPTRL